MQMGTTEQLVLHTIHNYYNNYQSNYQNNTGSYKKKENITKYMYIIDINEFNSNLDRDLEDMTSDGIFERF